MAQHRILVIAAAAMLLASLPTVGRAQGQSKTPDQADVTAPLPPRVRVVLNGVFTTAATTSFGDTRSFEEYVEQTTIRTGYENGSSFAPEVGVQVSLFRGLGVLASFSQTSRDITGSVDVSRPHPLYFNRPRSASAELGGYGYSERAIHVDVAYGKGAGHLDWSLFGGVTFFNVEVDLLGQPTYTDVYPYDELTIDTAPATTADASPTGFNVGGRVDYRFGQSGRLGVGALVLYSRGTAEFQASSEASAISLDVGGVQVGGGLRLYF